MSGGRCVGDCFLQTSADMCPADHGTVLPKDQGPVCAQRMGHLPQSPEIPTASSSLCHLECQY